MPRKLAPLVLRGGPDATVSTINVRHQLLPRLPLSLRPLPSEGAAAVPVVELLEVLLLAAVAAVPKVLLELLHNAEAPPETCHKIASATKAISAVMRQYSARS
jgi:hypothetical protein